MDTTKWRDTNRGNLTQGLWPTHCVCIHVLVIRLMKCKLFITWHFDFIQSIQYRNVGKKRSLRPSSNPIVLREAYETLFHFDIWITLSKYN